MLAIFLIVVAAIVLVALYFLRRSVRRLIRPTHEFKKSSNLCRCGYALTNLTVPRCPECGRVLGFDATAEELGLTRQELERAQAVRDQRERASRI
jgi:hypothetical protein